MTILRIASIMAVALLISLPATAAETKTNNLVTLAMVNHPSAGAADTKAYDQELALKDAEFRSFAKDKVKQFNRNLKFTKDRMQITRLADGSYLAQYHQIEEASVVSSIRRSQSKTSPYVGILSYKEQVYEAHGTSPEDCRNGNFSLTQITPNRHIFSYSKGTWR